MVIGPLAFIPVIDMGGWCVGFDIVTWWLVIVSWLLPLTMVVQ